MPIRKHWPWQFSNMHGDLVASLNHSDTGISATFEATEHGIQRSTEDVGVRRYGWHGAKQRATDSPSGIMLMGVRLYNNATGRFLQVDPVYGGSCGPYEHACADPVNKEDLDGKRCWVRKKWCDRLRSGARRVGNRVRAIGQALGECPVLWPACLKWLDTYIIAPLVIIGLIVFIVAILFKVIAAAAIVGVIGVLVMLVATAIVVAILIYALIQLLRRTWFKPSRGVRAE